MSATNLVLIGFMGCGKSSVGKLVAKDSSYYFLDTDSMIESAEGQSIEKIFKTHGEAYFRQCEKEMVIWLKSNVSGAIISTGGGMLAHCDSLNEVGKIIYLKVPFDVIISRMNDEELGKRPLFNDKEKARKMYEDRDLKYTQKADLIIDANTSLAELVLKLSHEKTSL
ncbi:MAG TPA: shikimate kinase [Sulfurimonas sp.]|nr:shikimate kinase [Sulfurimonas sp.]